MNKKREELKEKDAEEAMVEALIEEGEGTDSSSSSEADSFEPFVLGGFPHPNEQFTGEHFVEISKEEE